jgi:hypothetical protein
VRNFVANIQKWIIKKLGPRKYKRAPSDRLLREFAYLDEVSLRSLLSSQTGEVTETKSEQFVEAFENQVGTSAKAGSPFLSAELSSNFQTSNSSTLQTSRKATVQSWFREFHQISNLRLIEPIIDINPISDINEIHEVKDSSALIRTDALVRGSLVEFRVKLSADPVFHLGTMVTEFAGLAEDFPAMLTSSNVPFQLKDALLVNKALQRMLAGLIPIRAEAVQHVCVEVDGKKYVAHRDLLKNLQIDVQPLVIVGVTEHLAYWKDIRRVLFSDAEFTVLCRISRDGLHKSWNPVKLADIFRQIAPDLDEQLSLAGRLPFRAGSAPKQENYNELCLLAALRTYKALILDSGGWELTADQERLLEAEISSLRLRAGTASDQRSAFSVVSSLLKEMLGATLDPSQDLELRDAARASSGLSLFPSLVSRRVGVSDKTPEVPGKESALLLDVEVVAIYW